MSRSWSGVGSLLVLAAAISVGSRPALAQDAPPTDRSRDRGAGVPSSMFGTYIERHQLVLFPFVAYARDHNQEYQPLKLGYGLEEDYRGPYESSEARLFIGYGLTDWLALELEAGYTHATLDKAPGDTSAMPARIEESGLSDIEGQLRARLLTESEHRPEVFGYLEISVPSRQSDVLIGDSIWDVRPGIGVVRGFAWGTMTTRVTVEYNRDDQSLVLGEFSIEYLRRLSPSWRLNLAIEGGEGGAPDEWDLVTGVRWRISRSLFLKFDNALGLSSKATDWAPQLGIMLTLPH